MVGKPLRAASKWIGAHGGTLIDVALGLVVVAAAVADVADGVLTPAWSWLLLGLVSGAAVALLRRRQPLALLAGLLVLHAAVPAGPRTEPPFYYFIALVTAFSVGAQLRTRTALLALATLIASYAAYTLRSDAPATGILEAATGSVFLGVFTVMGLALSAARRRTERLQRSAADLIVEREGHARAAVEEERTRIAQELHDAVAHDVSVMTLQLGALRHHLRTDQDREREVLRQLERAGREAVDDLRRIVGILRRSEGPDRSPRPSMAQLERLVERVCDAGTPVDLQLLGDPAQLTPGVDASAYRIVQEALTNVLRHASGAPTTVRVHYTDDELRVDVVNRPPPSPVPSTPGPEPGHGLIGMRERAVLFGGRLDAGAQAEGGFAVRACFPLGGAQRRMVEAPVA